MKKEGNSNAWEATSDSQCDCVVYCVGAWECAVLDWVRGYGEGE